MGAIGEAVDSGGRPSQQLQQMMQRGRRDSPTLGTSAARDAYNRVRIVHYLDVFFFGAGFLLCTVTAYVLSKANYMAPGHQCILNASWKLIFDSSKSNSAGDYFDISAASSWGPERTCNLVQFGNVACAIGGFILCWFFLLLKPYADAYNNRYVPPERYARRPLLIYRTESVNFEQKTLSRLSMRTSRQLRSILIPHCRVDVISDIRTFLSVKFHDVRGGV